MAVAALDGSQATTSQRSKRVPQQEDKRVAQVLEPLMEGTYVTYPYLEFHVHVYRELVLRLV
jgi:hypothetical protein